jgi:hypothetical protein
MPMSRVLIEGSIAGILFGIYIKTGVSVDEGDTIITAITGVFEGLEKISVVTHNWRAWLFLFSIMFTLGSFSDVLTILREEGGYGNRYFALRNRICFRIVFDVDSMKRKLKQ